MLDSRGSEWDGLAINVIALFRHILLEKPTETIGWSRSFLEHKELRGTLVYVEELSEREETARRLVTIGLLDTSECPDS